MFSVGYKYRRGRVFGDRLRLEKVDEKFDNWNKDVLGCTCRLDEAWVGIDFVGSERLTLWSILNHCLVGQLQYCEI